MLGILSGVSFAGNADEAVVFYNEDGKVINGFTDEQGMDVSISFTASKDCNAAPVIAGNYSADGTLLSAEVLDRVKLSKGESAKIEKKSVQISSDAHMVKVFIWDSFATMKPMLMDFGMIKKQNFDIVFQNTDEYLYRVGNLNSVALGSLFKAADDVNSADVDVKVTKIDGTSVDIEKGSNTTDWTKETIAFDKSFTGPVKLTISDGSDYEAAELYVEVVNAKNITTAESATANNVVLLNDISGTFTVSNGKTFYGNGFKVTLPTSSVHAAGQGFTGYINIGAAQDDGVANGGNLDNVKIIGPVYPEMYIYRDQAKITDKNDADYGDGDNVRYFKNSVIIYGGNCTISNSYISGSRTPLCLRNGNNIVIENTTLSGGAYANMQIESGSSVTLRDLTTVQVDVPDSYGKGKTAHGLGIAVNSSVVDIYIEGELNQYNWINQAMWNSIVPSTYQSQFPKFFTETKFNKYWHYLNGGNEPYVNLAFIYACNWDKTRIHDKRTTIDYDTCDAAIAGVSGGVYSKTNTVGGDAITDVNLEEPAYVSPGFKPVAPVLNFDNSPNNDEDDTNDANDTYCVYNESTGVLKIGVSGDSKTIDLSKITVDKDGNTLEFTKKLNGNAITGNTVTVKAADGAKQTLTFETTTSDCGYDVYGNPVSGSIAYTWTVTLEVATLSYPAPEWNMGGDYQFDATANCVYAYYTTSDGYGEAVPIYEGIKINYYDKSGNLLNLDLSGTTTHPTGSNNSNANAFTYTLSDGSTLVMKYSSGWKSGASTHQFTTYNNTVYIYPQTLDADGYIREKTTNQDFDVKISYTFTDPNGQSISQTMQWYNAKANNGKVTTVQWKKFDSTNGKECITADTLITLADGTQKEVQDLTGEEKLLVWNLKTGAYEAASIVFVDSDNVKEYEVVNLYFSDGSKVGVIAEHGFFDLDLGKYVYIDAENANDYVGHKFVAQADIENNTWNVVTLDNVVIENKVTRAYSPVTFEHLCYYTDGILSMPGGISGLFNIFDVDTEIMAYDKAKMQKDIEAYGLFTYNDFEGVVSEIAYQAFNGDYLKVAIGKGLLTWEDIEYLAKRYMPLVSENK